MLGYGYFVAPRLDLAIWVVTFSPLIGLSVAVFYKMLCAQV